MNKVESRGALLVPSLVILAAMVTAVVLLFPGREGLEQRIALLTVPWSGLGIGLGLLWLSKRPEREDAVVKVLLGAALLLVVGTGLGVAFT